jgi:DNA-binding transcriptional LysR family regulator
VVRIGAPDDFGNLFLAKHIGELHRLHPGVKIELITLPYTLSYQSGKPTFRSALKGRPRAAFSFED